MSVMPKKRFREEAEGTLIQVENKESSKTCFHAT